MPFLIVRNDITKMRVDAVVNAAKPSLLGGGGVDGAIHVAAGPELLEACRKLGGCPVGEARATPGFRLPCSWVIHAVGPVWQGGEAGERELLLSCYRNSLALAEKLGCESLAFPLISSGAYGYPKQQAVAAAREAIEGFLQDSDMTVYLVVYGEESLAASRSQFSEIREYIDSRYVQEHPSGSLRRRERRERENLASAPASEEEVLLCAPFVCADRAEAAALPPPPAAAAKRKKARPEKAEPGEWRYGELDESFQQMLLRCIDLRGMTDAECYKRANIDRRLFSKIRGDVHYKPSKPTAAAFAVALRLDLDQTRELLGKAGYSLTRSSRFDLILQYYIEHGDYDLFKINTVLFAFDQPLLGNVS